MRIQNNIPAYNAHRNYNIANSAIASSAEKLSSGYRINRAGDDAAGLAISEKMRAQIRGLEMASKNTSDAISMIQTAEGALQKTHDILQRMRELAVQSSSDTNQTVVDREALNLEFQALKSEVDDIARVTRFNDQNLIDGTFQANRSVVAPYTSGAPSTSVAGLGTKLSISVEGAAPGFYSVGVTAKPGVPADIQAGSAATISTADMGAATNTVFAGVTFAGVATSAHNGNIYTLQMTGSTLSNATITMLDSNMQVVSKIDNLDMTQWIGSSSGAAESAAFSLNFANVGVITVTMGSSQVISDFEQAQNFIGSMKLDFTTDGGKDAIVTNNVVAKVELTINGESVSLIKGDTYANFVQTGITVNFFGELTDADITSAGFEAFMLSEGTVIGVANETRAPMIIQSGANQYDETRININSMNARFLGIAHSNVSTQKASSNAITEVTNALNKVSTQRAELGALQNRLTFKGENLDISAENLTAAESRIRDVDMAKEMSAFSKKNIVSQAATAMLAQANALPQNVLQLLR